MPLAFTFRQGSKHGQMCLCICTYRSFIFPPCSTNSLKCCTEPPHTYLHPSSNLRAHAEVTASLSRAHTALTTAEPLARCILRFVAAFFPSAALSRLLSVLSAHFISAKANFSGFTFAFKLPGESGIIHPAAPCERRALSGRQQLVWGSTLQAGEVDEMGEMGNGNWGVGVGVYQSVKKFH